MLYNYNDSGKTKCLCDCDCGKHDVIKDSYELRKAVNPSCGCKRFLESSKRKNINGLTFGYLTVLETLWDENPVKIKCKCKCGNIRFYVKRDVVSGHTKSCGCYNLERISKRNMAKHYNKISKYGIEILAPSRLNNKKQWLWKCKCFCGIIFEDLPARILNGHVRSCGCLKSSSRERFIENLFIKNNIDYVTQFSLDGCKSNKNYSLRFDFAVFKDSKVFLLLEYDGEQHFKPIEFWGGEKTFNELVERDNIKNQYCQDNNITLLRIPYYFTEDEIENKILNIINP